MGLWLRDSWNAQGSNGTGVLLLHGFSGDPKELLPLAEGLAQAGYGVHIPVLPGHGGVPHELIGVGWRDWLGAAASPLAALRQEYAQVLVGGFSMGGALAVLLASQQPVDGLILLATPTTLSQDWRLALLPVVKHLMPWFKPLAGADFSTPAIRQQIADFDPTLNLDDPQVQAGLRNHVRLPVAALHELVRLLATMRGVVPLITSPALVMHGVRDDVALPLSATELARRLGGPTELVWWERSGHMLLAGPEAEAIVQRAIEFGEALRCSTP